MARKKLKCNFMMMVLIALVTLVTLTVLTKKGYESFTNAESFSNLLEKEVVVELVKLLS